MERNGKIISNIKVCLETKFGNNVCHIEDFVIDSEYRNRGIGKYMLNYIIKNVKSNNIYKIVLECKKELEKIYESCGFLREGNEMVIRL